MNSQYPPRPLLQLGTSLVLAGIMGVRWSKSGKIMPAGAVCVISAAAFIRGLVVYRQHLSLPEKIK